MKIHSILIVAALVIGVAAVVILFLVPGFKNWFFLLEMIVIGLIVAAVVIYNRPPK